MSTVQWDCKIAGREVGPLSSQQVVEMARTGQLRPDDLVRKGSAGQWVEARRIKGLAFAETDIPVAEIVAGPTASSASRERNVPSGGNRQTVQPTVTYKSRVRSAKRRRNMAFLLSAGAACGAIVLAFSAFTVFSQQVQPRKAIEMDEWEWRDYGSWVGANC